MKKVLITGANSYIGTSFENWVKDKYQVDTIDMMDANWRNTSFIGYDVVFHVAGIAHVSTDPKMEELYYQVNRDLTIEVAKKAKEEQVKQFIFMSSAIVYGDSSKIGKSKLITKETIPTPANFYGKSKLEAEEGILPLASERFQIVVLRPPMIYGKNSKGNYVTLSKYAKKLPFFPNIKNERSMLHIDNLCEFIRLMIENEESGLFFPQNEEYVSTSNMVKTIALVSGKTIKLTKLFNPFIKVLGLFTKIVNKVFGSLTYDKEMSIYKENYWINDFTESIEKTEKRDI